MDIKTEKSGQFKRKDSSYHNWIKPDEGEFVAEKDRYHLYVSYACPWANRTLIMRALKGLESFISISVVNPFIEDEHWNFKPGPGVIEDPLFGAEDMNEVYSKLDPDFNGYDTVPLLVDKKNKRIVNNESSEIIRIFNTAFDEKGAKEGDYYPEELRGEIDKWNDLIYETVNNGVYKAGFATSQEAYDEAVTELFDTLDKLEEHLEGKEYLVGDKLTEADIRLFVTLIRFDPVYVGHFKCNKKTIGQYKNLSSYVGRLYAIPEIKDTIHFDHITEHYYKSHEQINPTRIVPVGPVMDYLK